MHDLATRAAQALAAGAVCVEPHFLAATELRALRAAADTLRPYGHAAAVGESDAADVTLRKCATLDLLNDETAALPPALFDVMQKLDALRAGLATHSGRPLIDSAEMQLLFYPPGGHYGAHVDDGASTATWPVRRSVSLLLYLTPDDWHAPRDGGSLRIHHSDHRGECTDVEPRAGTLVLFDSASVRHEVLVTRRPRVAVVGWLLEPRTRTPRVGRLARTAVS